MIKSLVKDQTKLLEQGEVLKAFDKYYSNEVIMYDNDKIFAKGKEGARELQKIFFSKVTNFRNKITKVIVVENISIIESKFSFNHSEMGHRDVRGIYIQHWNEGKIVVEYFYTGKLLEEKISEIKYLQTLKMTKQS